jgi:hypothetical protein
MKTLFKFVSFAGLALMFTSAVLVFTDRLGASTYHTLSLVGTVMWFVPVPFWMKRRLHDHS